MGNHHASSHSIYDIHVDEFARLKTDVVCAITNVELVMHCTPGMSLPSLEFSH